MVFSQRIYSPSIIWIGKIKNALLFSTDIHLPPEQIITYYQARFQIEFVFRDAKQFTALADCQSPHPQRLDFHFNASLTSLNLAKYQADNCHSSSQPFVFSMAAYKRLQQRAASAFNIYL